MLGLAVALYLRLAGGGLAAALLGAALLALSGRLGTRKGPPAGHRCSFGRAAVTLLFTAAVAALLATSLAALGQAGRLGGWYLFFHTAAGGVLVAVLPLAGLVWLGAGTGRRDTKTGFRWQPAWSLSSLLLGAALTAALVTAGAMLLSMLPLLDTDRMLQMLTLHAYGGLALGIFTILYLGSLLTGHRSETDG